MTKPQFHIHGCRAAGFLILCLLLTGADLKPGDVALPDSVSYRMEGRQLQAAGDMEKASAAFRRAVTLNPRYAEAYNDLGVVLESMGNLEGAEQAYTSALIEDSELAAAHSNLALLYEEQGRTQDAAKHWVARVRLGPPDDPWVLKARERISAHKVPVEDTPKEAAEKRNAEVKLAILQGQIHMDAHEWDKAILEFQRALDLEPGSSKAARYLGAARLKAKGEERKVAREFEISKKNVLKEREIANKDWAMKQKEEARLAAEERRKEALREEAIRREEEAQQRKVKPVKKAAPARVEAPAKPWWKFWAADEKSEPVKIEPVKKAAPARVETSAKPWWKFWAKEPAAAAPVKSKKSQREKEIEKEIERARKLSEAREKALRQAVEIMREPAPAPVAPKPAPVVVKPPPPPAPKSAPVVVKPPPPPAPKPAPVVVKPPPPPAPVGPAVSTADALKMAREYARERSKSTARAEEDLYRRGIAAMREGSYQDAAEHFRQALLLNPGNQDAKNALARAEKAWEKERQEQGLDSF